MLAVVRTCGDSNTTDTVNDDVSVYASGIAEVQQHVDMD
jgi:hypothetical protein